MQLEKSLRHSLTFDNCSGVKAKLNGCDPTYIVPREGDWYRVIIKTLKGPVQKNKLFYLQNIIGLPTVLLTCGCGPR